MNADYRRIVKNATFFQKMQKHSPFLPPCIAVMDTGIYPHRDLGRRILGFYDVLKKHPQPYDDNGHGTHISGIIAGASPGRYRGIFPRATLFGIKTLADDGTGKIGDFIAGIDFLLHNHKANKIRIINISLGGTYDGSDEQKMLIDYVERAWDLGLLVVAAAGNNGPERGTVTVPGVSKKVITVGTWDDNIPAVNPSTGKRFVHYSGRGPTSECIVKPDILCPGANILSLNASYAGYTVKSGTSMSTPMISAVCGLVLSYHPDLTPKELKKAVKASCFPNSRRFDSQKFFSCFL